MALEENKAFLRRVPLLYSLNEQQIESLAAGSVRRNYPKGRTIVSEGEPSQSLYILLSGRAKVQRSDLEGKEVILSQRRGHWTAMRLRSIVQQCSRSSRPFSSRSSGRSIGLRKSGASLQLSSRSALTPEMWCLAQAVSARCVGAVLEQASPAG